MKNLLWRALCAGLAVLALAITQAHADVVDVSAQGFLLRHEAVIKGEPAVLYAKLLDPGNWWNGAHSYSGDAKNMTIDARPGGCFCEKLASGGGVMHMTVLTLMPGTLIRLSGALGPFQSSGLAGTLSWSLAPAAGGMSKVVWTYSIGGYMQGGFEKIAPAANGMLGEQMGRFKAYAETGKPELPKAPTAQ